MMFVDNSDYNNRYLGYNPAFAKRVREKQLRARQKAREAERVEALAREKAEKERLAAEIRDADRRRAERQEKLRLRLAEVDRRRREHEEDLKQRAAHLAQMGQFARYRLIELRACVTFGITLAELRGPCRAVNMANARQFVCYWAYRRTKLSLKQIGQRLGNRDHATIFHGTLAYPAKRSAMGRTLRKAR